MAENMVTMEEKQTDDVAIKKKKKTLWGALGKFIIYGGWILIIVIGLGIAIAISIATSGSS
jgi:hypothetical protein